MVSYTDVLGAMSHPHAGGDGLSKGETNGAGGSSQLKKSSQVLSLQSVRDIIVKA